MWLPCFASFLIFCGVRAFKLSSVKVVGSHQQLKAEISRNIHVSHTGALSMLLVVIKVFDDFLKDDTAQVLEVADTTLSFTEVV